MDVLYGLDARTDGQPPAAVTVGKFTVVHRGHRALLERTAAAARAIGGVATVVTFDREPLETLAPDRAPACRLATLDQRLEMFEEAGVELVLVLEFTDEIAGLSPQDFVKRVLVDTLHARAVVVGADFRFGHGRAGDIPRLEELGAQYGFRIEAVRLVGTDGDKVSSSTIRELVTSGRVEDAAEVWGRAFRLAGVVVEGAKRGKTIGFPTANLRPAERACLPAFGVYAGWWRCDGRRLPGVINVGMTPTFTDVKAPKVEIHVFDFDGDLYGRDAEIEFSARLREERTFASIEALVAQIRSDARAARDMLGA